MKRNVKRSSWPPPYTDLSGLDWLLGLPPSRFQNAVEPKRTKFETAVRTTIWLASVAFAVWYVVNGASNR